MKLNRQIVKRSHRAIRFKVDDVPLATETLREVKTHDAIGRRVNGRVEACLDWTSTTVACGTHPLVEACVRAWLDHRPLVLTPDTIWIALAQSFAQHVNANAEELRSRLVFHEGKKKLEVDGNALGFTPRSPENPWPLAFSAWGEQIKAASKGGYELVVTSFSTTGPVELAAQQVILMDTFKAYFDYEVACMCGLPEVTLVGEVRDYELLREKARAFGHYGLEEWSAALDPILARLVDTSKGKPDAGFWRDLVQHHLEDDGGYGGPTALVDGWITTLLPFGPEAASGTRFGQKRGLDDFPSGLSRAPVVETSRSGNRNLELLAGFVGLTQESISVRPRIGWAVREVR